MDIVEITPDDRALVEGFVAVTNAVNAVDSPWDHPQTVAGYTGMLRHGWDGEPPHAFVGRLDDAVVAQGEYSTTEWDNTHLAWVWLAVHPDHRRRGLGSAMLEHLIARAKAEGKTVLGTDGWDSPTTAAFAAAHGLERKSQAIQRRQTLADLDRALVRKRCDEAAAAASAYELVRIAGRTPEELLEAVATMTAAINDAPTDDLDIEDEVFPPERIRRYEDAQLAREYRLYRLLARHRETGGLAGHTVVAVEGERPHLGHQHDTSVVRAHRGHRLGMLLKAGMLEWLADVEPQLATVDTWNAESNDHMIGVNEELGYQVLGRGIQFQRSV
ncbi:MAG TPA: GNAT family N-acetyltransferase [Nocardioidaceae bacterium]|nr:GNAT family N-acetyltransferase [Nocardioidaceae bacterium]